MVFGARKQGLGPRVHLLGDDLGVGVERDADVGDVRGSPPVCAWVAAARMQTQVEVHGVVVPPGVSCHTPVSHSVLRYHGDGGVGHGLRRPVTLVRRPGQSDQYRVHLQRFTHVTTTTTF